MFNFRIIDMKNGSQVIDTSLKTPFESLTCVQMVEYIEMEGKLEIMDRLKQKRIEVAEKKRRLARNPIYKLACFFGLI